MQFAFVSVSFAVNPTKKVSWSRSLLTSSSVDLRWDRSSMRPNQEFTHTILDPIQPPSLPSGPYQRK